MKPLGRTLSHYSCKWSNLSSGCQEVVVSLFTILCRRVKSVVRVHDGYSSLVPDYGLSFSLQPNTWSSGLRARESGRHTGRSVPTGVGSQMETPRHRLCVDVCRRMESTLRKPVDRTLTTTFSPGKRSTSSVINGTPKGRKVYIMNSRNLG